MSISLQNIQRQHIQQLVKLLEHAYYIDGDMIRGAIQHQSTFNVFHNETDVKVDIFVLKSSPIARQELQRAREEMIEPGSRPFYFASPEDVILNKSSWWKMGGSILTRQWNDLLEVIKRQANTLDTKYLRQSAPLMEVADILEQAFIDAGMQ
jgi:hypothetical protein